MSFCKDCVSGVQHEGTPTGKIEPIGGVTCYVATPAADYPKNKVLLLLPDLFGMEFVNNQLLADCFAANGFKTIIPDYLAGDAVPGDAMGPGKTFDAMAWFTNGNHGPAGTRPILDAVISALKADGVTTFGATGYCLGGRSCMDLAIDNVTSVVVLSHPSMLSVPEDFEKLKAHSRNPVLLNTCETDVMFPPEKQAIADALLGGGQYAPGYTRNFYAGCAHGFASRGDTRDPLVKAGKEGAFRAAVEFFIRHL